MRHRTYRPQGTGFALESAPGTFLEAPAMMLRVTFFTLLAAFSSAALSQAPGVTPQTIVLGQSAAFTGPAAQLGIQLNAGTKAYFDHVNALGGIYGRKIELRTRDDRYE